VQMCRAGVLERVAPHLSSPREEVRGEERFLMSA
jgi:hypothetical protein